MHNTLECAGYYRMGLRCHPAYGRARAGQFVMIRVGSESDPFLRRPFSIHRLISENGQVTGLEILYKIVGRGTQILASRTKGDSVELLGPLGRGFQVPEGLQRAFLVAGGIGVAPLFFLASKLGEGGVDLKNCVLFIGGSSRDDLLCLGDFVLAGMETIQITTDDGSAGEKAFVTAPLDRMVQEARPDIIYACGPLPMLKVVADMSRRHGIACQISIESVMACGMGACLGCAFWSDEDSRYIHACVDGPVVDAARIRLWR